LGANHYNKIFASVWLVMMMHICNPSTQEDEAVVLHVQGQLVLQSETLSPKTNKKDKKMPSLKK
jgi:hypothetical protein